MKFIREKVLSAKSDFFCTNRCQPLNCCSTLNNTHARSVIKLFLIWCLQFPVFTKPRRFSFFYAVFLCFFWSFGNFCFFFAWGSFKCWVCFAQLMVSVLPNLSFKQTPTFMVRNDENHLRTGPGTCHLNSFWSFE